MPMGLRRPVRFLLMSQNLLWISTLRTIGCALATPIPSYVGDTHPTHNQGPQNHSEGELYA